MAKAQRSGGLVSVTEMPHIARSISSRIMRLIASPTRLNVLRRALELKRKLSGAPHRVHYFHQVEDPYSHLAVQAIGSLCERYDIEVVPHLAGPDTGPNQPEPELLASLARRDCQVIAPYYGLDFPESGAPLSDERIRAVQRSLVAASSRGGSDFASTATELGRALWGGDEGALKSLCGSVHAASLVETDRIFETGRALRSRWGHYSGAMFWYAGEWYWGVDRLYHLEARLTALGAARSNEGVRFTRPELVFDRVPGASQMTLEVFPSLRSPYTAISFERTLELAERTGVELRIRPVLPMVMRGVPAPFAKGKYIMLDTLREAQAMQVPFGRIFDPIGDPVRRAYSLWPWANAIDKGPALLASFLRAAFAEGIDTSTDVGLRSVVERAGLSWEVALTQLGDSRWETELEVNRLVMLEELGQWGVPSYRLMGPANDPAFCVWGQDRLWLLAREIQNRGRSAA